MIMAYRGILTNRAKTISPETVLSQCQANEGIFYPPSLKTWTPPPLHGLFDLLIMRFYSYQVKPKVVVKSISLIYMRLDLNGARSLL